MREKVTASDLFKGRKSNYPRRSVSPIEKNRAQFCINLETSKKDMYTFPIDIFTPF